VAEGTRTEVSHLPHLPDGEENLRKLYASVNTGSGLDLKIVAVTVGPETYSPIKYNSFTVGPITVGCDIKPGETIEGAYIRAHIQAAALLECEYKLSLARHFGRLKDAVKAAAKESMGRDVVDHVRG